MTADIRTAAEDAMIRANAVEPLVVVDGEEAVMQLTDYGNGFIQGAVWAAARALEEAADEIFVPHNENRDMSDAFHRGADAVYDALRARAEAYRQESGEQ